MLNFLMRCMKQQVRVSIVEEEEDEEEEEEEMREETKREKETLKLIKDRQ